MCPSAWGDGRAGGDVSRDAGAGAAHDDGPGACLGRNQQVTCADAGADLLVARQAQDAVRARVPVALGERSARYAAPSALNPGGTKSALSTPMSPPCGRLDTTSVTTEPSGPMA